MLIKKYENMKKGSYTKALRFIKEKEKKVKLVLSYSVATDGEKWIDDKGKGRLFALLGNKNDMFNVKALVLGRFKLSVLVGR